MIINAVGLALCCMSDFVTLVQIAITLNSIALTLQFAALCWLRFSEPTMKRPYRIPLTLPYLIVFSLPHLILTVILLVTVDTTAQIVVAVTVVVGFISYPVARAIARWRAPASLPISSSVSDPSARGETVDDTVDLCEVFEDMSELRSDEQASDVFPSVGLRSAIQAESLPEQLLGGGMTESSGSEASDDESDDGDRSPLMIRSPKRPPHNQASAAHRFGANNNHQMFESRNDDLYEIEEAWNEKENYHTAITTAATADADYPRMTTQMFHPQSPAALHTSTATSMPSPPSTTIATSSSTTATSLRSSDVSTNRSDVR